jgi:hypothetical protein
LGAPGDGGDASDSDGGNRSRGFEEDEAGGDEEHSEGSDGEFGDEADDDAAADLCGPLVLALTLAQVLLWCIDVRVPATLAASASANRPAARCQRETLLGTAVVVSCSAWAAATLW